MQRAAAGVADDDVHVSVGCVVRGQGVSEILQVLLHVRRQGTGLKIDFVGQVLVVITRRAHDFFGACAFEKTEHAKQNHGDDAAAAGRAENGEPVAVLYERRRHA